MGPGARCGGPPDASRRTPISYRRSLGWLIGLVVIPLLIAAIGYAPSPAAHAPPVAASSDKPGKPPLSLAPLSIARNGNDITLTGEFPDDYAKAVLTKALKGALPAGVNIIDRIQINPNVDTLDFSNAGPIFKNSASITDFGLTVNGDMITLTGTAASQDQKTTIDTQAARTWSNLTVVDQLAVDGSPMVVPRVAGSKSWGGQAGPRHGSRDPLVVVSTGLRGGLGGRLVDSRGHGCAPMTHLNWWLFGVSFAMGLVLTFAFLGRPVKREVALDVPVDHPVIPDPPTTKIPVAQRESPTRKIAVPPPAPYGPGSAPAGPGGRGPAGWLVKARTDTRLYYTPDTADYDPAIAQVWFCDEQSALRAGFTPWHNNSGT